MHTALTCDLTSGGPNPKVFFDMTIGGEDAGRIVMELRADGEDGSLLSDSICSCTRQSIISYSKDR